MSKEKVEYDFAVGGSVELPDLVKTYKYAADRVIEIDSLISSINNPNQTKLVFQKLPKHMRRRAMSHNPKRLPRKYRQSHVAQMLKSGSAVITKRPSRKYRRKANNLMKEYIRRQKKHIWLETHIWHAKRFHMIERWGYRLPLRSCDKTFRSNYRATTKHCLVQDISYVGCIELTGPMDIFKVQFERMRSQGERLGLCAKAFTGGKREGSINLFKADQCPLGVLGTVNFLWKPDDEESSKNRTVWLFAHASFYRELINELQELFELKSENRKCSNSMNLDDIGEMEAIQIPRYFNPVINVELLELKDTLNRFRLTGPLSQAVLSNAFICSKQTSADNQTWFGEFLNAKSNAEAHHFQSSYWSKLKTITSPSELCPNMILALNIEDPRTVRPKKRSKSLPDVDINMLQCLNSASVEIPKYNGASQLWILESRARILKEKVATNEYCQMRNKHVLVPGERCAFENNLQPIPVILIQRPGATNPKFNKLGYGCGWDVIVPAGYGISTWISLIMWGARAGGLREQESICRESGNDEFLPDTIAATHLADELAKNARESYFRLPPNKRPNFKKISIASPFKCPWLQLVQEWCNSSKPISNYFVIRQTNILEQIQNAITRKMSLQKMDIPENCLIPIYLKMENRGHPEKYSIICLPTKNDTKRNWKKKQNFEKEPVHTEPAKIDDQAEARKILRKNHLRLLRRLRRRRIRAKRRKQQTSKTKVLIAKPQTAKLVLEQRRKIREMWLPEQPANVRNQCSRQVIGYLTQGDFSFTEATAAGVGYITLNGFKTLLRDCYKGQGQNCLLIRSPTSNQYRFATFKIKCE